MKKWALRIAVIFGVLLILATTVFTLDWLEVVDVRAKVANVPLINKIMPVKSSKKAKIVKPNPLELENKKIKQENQRLEEKLATAQKDLVEFSKKEKKFAQEKANLADELKKMQLSIAETKKNEEEQSIQSNSYEQLAKYYGAMKAKDAIPSLEKLDDETLIGILIKLEEEQAAEILSKLNPERAADIVKNLATN